jgi:hypothetical protein
MIAVELEAVINEHHLEVTSQALPEQTTKARVIVLYEETAENQTSRESDIDMILARTRGILGSRSLNEIDAELAEMRKEWDERNP